MSSLSVWPDGQIDGLRRGGGGGWMDGLFVEVTPKLHCQTNNKLSECKGRSAGCLDGSCLASLFNG